MKLCSITSGSSGNCTLVGSDSTNILVDCGSSAKNIFSNIEEIDKKPLSAVLVTHEHLDHIRGLGVILRKLKIPAFMTKQTKEYIIRSNRCGIIDEKLLNIIEIGKDFYIDDIKIHPFSTYHDAADPVAYTFFNGCKKIGIITDIGTFDNYIIENLIGLDALLVEANYDIKMLECGPYPYDLKIRIQSDTGHLSNIQTSRLIKEVINNKLKNILLGHISEKNNNPDLALITIKNELKSLGINIEKESINIITLNKDRRSKVLEI